MHQNDLRTTDRVFVAGHRGLVGSALIRCLRARGYANLVVRSRSEVDLEDQGAVRDLFQRERPDVVFLAAAKVGGILANDQFPADFIRSNLAIQTNVIELSREFGVRKLVFLGSSCIYPKHAQQPIPESALLTGLLEPTNEAYAIAKIAGIKMCQAYHRQHGSNFISLMPTNLYGPGDNFDLSSSHVIPALMRKFDDAKRAGGATVDVWGSGRARREFLHVDDLASAAVFLGERYASPEIINVGTGEDVTIADLARLVSEAVGFGGEIRFDAEKPDGTPRKLLDVARLRQLGWAPAIELREGLRATYAWYVTNYDQVRRGSLTA